MICQNHSREDEPGLEVEYRMFLNGKRTKLQLCISAPQPPFETQVKSCACSWKAVEADLLTRFPAFKLEIVADFFF